MAKCSLCQKEDLCFTCPYCGGLFCSEHRLPESHGCPELHRVRESAKKRVRDSVAPDITYGNETVRRQRFRRRTSLSRGRFSSTEIRDLSIAIILVILVGISMIGSPYGVFTGFSRVASLIQGGYWWYPFWVIVIFAAAFIVHELSHKFLAQHYGLWSEFRMMPMGYYLSALAILFSVPIFGTGTVYTSGTSSLKQSGKTNLAGPLSNLLMGLLIALTGVALSVMTVGLAYPIPLLVSYGLQINAVLGLFNMIPFQPFDGGTVWVWNRGVWVLTVLSLAGLLVFAFIGVPYL
ncbi:MAG: AN1-type zinc finger domain-containing protein [Candidatus Thorarchaeota archaeon]